MDKLQEKTEYCLNCINKPCALGCPLGNDIPSFIRLAKEQKYKEAFDVLCKTTVMPFICGKICPKSVQCQRNCVRGIKGDPVSIGSIESSIGDMALENGWYLDIEKPKPNGKEVAIIGSGPAGITAGIWLARAGTDVTIYEKREKIGGILRYGIPDFRLEKKYIDTIEKYIKTLGIQVKCNEEPNIEELKKQYDDVILCFGANKSSKMGIPGEELPNVYGANELLEYENFPEFKGKEVVVIGGGNVAIDSARVIKRLGAKKVTIAYRRARPQMPAEPTEIEEAISDGVEFLFQANAKEIEDKRINLVKTELVQKEGDRRLVPVEIPESRFTIMADYVIMAIGSKLKEIDAKIELTEKGYIKTDENYQTSIPNVYACGDCIGQNATVAWASFSGREVAKAILKIKG